MVAQSPPIPFTLDPARVEEFLQDISSFDMCICDVASKWGTTVGGLALFITSEDGLQTIATAELAAALRIRLTALNLLPSVVEALGYIVMEYAREERSILPESSLRHIRLLELKRANAHRAGTLIFKLAHFNPKPIKSYTVRPAAPSDQTCGMPKRPLGHGEATDLDYAPDSVHDPVPPVRRFGATGGLDTAATADSSASPRATDIDGSASTSVQDDQDAPSTSTSDSPGSAIESTGEAALRAAHPRTTSQEAGTLKGSSPSQTSDPHSTGTVPQSFSSGP